MQTTAWQEAVIRLSAGAGKGTAVVYNQGWMVASMMIEPWKGNHQSNCLFAPLSILVLLACDNSSVVQASSRRPDMWPMGAYALMAPSQCRVRGTTRTSTTVLYFWYKERYSEPRPPQPQRVARSARRIRRPAEAFALRLMALKWKEMRPAQPLTPKLAYISASFVIPLYKTLAYHVHIHLCHAVMPMAGRDCMTCVCYFLSALTEPRTCISST